LTKHWLDPLFRPRHVLVAGISQDRSKTGYGFLRKLLDLGFAGEVSILGRTAGEMDGCRVYASPEDLPDGIDLVLNLMNVDQTVATLPRIAQRGIPVAVVFTSGFAEQDEASADRQHEMVAACRAAGMRIVGPNCMGIFNLHHKMWLSGGSPMEPGPISMISQSGNVAVDIWDQARLNDIGFASFIGFGNQADIPVHDYIDYLSHDDDTEAIVLYIEGLQPGAGGDFIDVVGRAARRKPIVALKGGRGAAGMRAVASHTATLTSSRAVFSAILREAGVHEVERIQDVLPAAEALVRSPAMRGNRVAVIGSGGGHSTTITDAIEGVGLEVPEYSEGLRTQLRSMLPAFAPVRNPVDMAGAYTSNPGLFVELSRLAVATDGPFDAIVNYGLYGAHTDDGVPAASPYTYTTAAPLFGEMQRDLGIPVLFQDITADAESATLSLIRKSSVACVPDASTVGVALSALRERSLFLDRGPDPAPVALAAPEGAELPATPTEADAMRYLAAHGVTFPASEEVEAADAAGAAARIGFPVVVKAILDGVEHKSELGAVRLGLGSESGVRDAVAEIEASVRGLAPAAWTGRFLITRDLGRRRELLVGVTRDISLGVAGLIGQGGVYAEGIADTTVVPLPATAASVMRALATLRSKAVWGAFRGEPALDADALAGLLNSLGRALAAAGDAESIECNPCLVVDGQPVPVDASISFPEVHR
jgi:acyl-CoA synthetase (NDP forming)